MNEREQIINVLLSWCDQKNAVIADLQKQNAELQKQLAELAPKVPTVVNGSGGAVTVSEGDLVGYVK